MTIHKRSKWIIIFSLLFIFHGFQGVTNALAHPLDLGVMTLKEHGESPGRFTLSFQLTAVTTTMPLTTLVIVPGGCQIIKTEVDIDNVSQYRYRQELHCTESGFSNKHFSFLLSEDTNIMVRLLRGEALISEQLLEQGVMEWEYDVKEQTILSILGRYVILGVEHILIGLDHLVFVCMLLLMASWGKRLIILVTAFTVGHSITLALATLNILNLPSPPVEATIALSIVFLAAEIIRSKNSSGYETLTMRYPGMITSLFGCLHGLGFASVLADVGVSQGGLLWNLIGFNLGVEIGQILFILAILFIIHIIRSSNQSLLIGKIPVAYVGGSIGAFWFIQRVTSF